VGLVSLTTAGREMAFLGVVLLSANMTCVSRLWLLLTSVVLVHFDQLKQRSFIKAKRVCAVCRSFCQSAFIFASILTVWKKAYNPAALR